MDVVRPVLRRWWLATLAKCVAHTQRLTWHDDGTLDFHVRVSGIGEISWWIMGYGDQAEVLEPEPLRELIARRAERMLEQYRGQAVTLADR